MKKLEENFVGAIWQKLMEANVKILECSDGRKLIVTLFSINDELALKEFLQKTVSKYVLLSQFQQISL